MTSVNAYTPEVPVFNDETDNIDAYLERFDRLAKIYQWSKQNWAVMLSALLSGRALEVYVRLSYDEATNYTKVKSALLKRYSLTEKGFRLKFQDSKPEENENPTQFATKLAHYLDRWLDMASVTDYDNLKTLLVREQFLKAGPQNVAIHNNNKCSVSSANSMIRRS